MSARLFLRIFALRKEKKKKMTTQPNMHPSPLKVAIVGGGAAGFFAAIAAKEAHPAAHVTIFEKSQKVLAKVGLSGGGRCNLTNSFAQIKDLKNAYPRGDKLMKRLFNVFNHEDAHRWFETHGVKLVTQTDECVFPQSQSSQSIIDCLVQTAHRLGVKVQTRQSLCALQPQEDGLLQLSFTNGQRRVFHRVAITTGGSPRAESLQYLAHLGHAIIPPVPSLFTFNIASAAFRSLMGLVAEGATASIPGTKLRATGSLLITHWGVSGPAILKLSSYAARYVSEQNYRFPLSINWIGPTHTPTATETLQRLLLSHPQKQLSGLRPYGLATRLWLYLLDRLGLEPDRRCDELGKKNLHRLVETLTNDRYEVTGKGTFRDEFVTCGGIALSHLHLNTLESKVCRHLFFAGEVLDIDAITGGFNLQAAWTTGYVAGRSLVADTSTPPHSSLTPQ